MTLTWSPQSFTRPSLVLPHLPFKHFFPSLTNYFPFTLLRTKGHLSKRKSFKKNENLTCWRWQRNQVKGIVQPTRHAPWETVLSGFQPVRLAHPATQLALHPSSRDGDGVSLVFGYDHSFALHAGHILWVCTGQPTARQKMLLQNNYFRISHRGTADHLCNSYQFSYLGSLLTMPSLSRPARMLAVSSGVPVTMWTLAGLHSSTAPFTKSATAGGREGMEARERTPTLAPTPPCL